MHEITANVKIQWQRILHFREIKRNNPFKENRKREQGTNVTVEWKGILNVRKIQT